MDDNDYQSRSQNTAVTSPSVNLDSISIASSHYDESCGWSKCKPSKLQKLNSPKWFLFFLAVFSVSQAMIVNGFTNVGLATLEKQFKLTSKQSGMIVAAKEISSVLLIAFLSFYGSFGHKPKYLGYGAFLTAAGSMLYVLPHALIGKHIPTSVSGFLLKNQEMCTASALNETISEARCELLGSSEWYYLFVFIVAKLLIGAGIAPLFTLGAAYVDENVKPKVAPMYLGVWYVCTSFGPGIGFVAGGSLLNIYVDLIQPPGVDLKPDDPEWIGAWWLGHFFGAILIFMSACALLAYPKSMPGAKEIRRQAIIEGTLRPEDQRLQGKFSDIFPATLTLLKNLTFIFNTLALTSTTVISTGLGPFVVKYLVAQFGVSEVKAGIASGIALIPGTAGGIFLGTYLMRRLKGRNTCKGAAKYCFVFQVLAVLSVGSFLIPGCESPNIVGVHQPYYNESTSSNLTSSCNLKCACAGVQYDPVCSVDKKTYFSPCHMGCLRKENKKFGECSCLNPDQLDKLTTTAPLQLNATLNYSMSNRSGNYNKYLDDQTPVASYLGECDRGCKNMIPFLCAVVVLLILNFVNAVPNKMVVMRCVPDNERAYALGIQWIILTLLGALPGPVLFGIFIDKTCDLWEETCHGQGNCLVYDNKLLSYRLAGAILLFEALAAVFYFLSWKCYHPLKESEHPMENLQAETAISSPHNTQSIPPRPLQGRDSVMSPDLTLTTQLSSSRSSSSSLDVPTTNFVLDSDSYEDFKVSTLDSDQTSVHNMHSSVT